MKKYSKQAINTSLHAGKKLVTKHPRIKRYVKETLERHLSPSMSGSTVDLVRELHYSKWVQRNYPDAIEILRQRNIAKEFKTKPLISIIIPLYDTPEELLHECIQSVLSQTYENWELCLVDDASTQKHVARIIKEYASEDERIHTKIRRTNGHISVASNDALSMAKGDFIALLDHDDMLWPNALFEVALRINDNDKVDFIYSDEEKITVDRHDHKYPFFKPDWNPEFLESVNYITHFAVIRTDLVKKLGGFRDECKGAQDWDLFLRVSEITEKIVHIPTVLYSWRITDNSTAKDTKTKPYVRDAQRKALEDHFIRTGKNVELRSGVIEDYWFANYRINGNPQVSIVIPSKNQYDVIKRCIDSIYAKSTYSNFEVILVDTGSDDKKLLRWYAGLVKEKNNLRIIQWPEKPFSYSRACNEGAKHAKGEYLVMLNNDTEVITNNWIELLLGDAQREEIGAVGCKLYYPGKFLIQHAGVNIGICGIAANSLAMVSDNALTSLQHLYANTRHAMSAVTAACLMISKDKFDSVGGFDESLRITYNDVDLCLRLNKRGLRNIYTPHVQLVHHESISVGRPEDRKKRDSTEIIKATELFQKRWKKYIKDDPHFNKNFSRDTASLEINHN